MPLEERNHDRAVWLIHSLMNGECTTINERFKALDDLSKLPFETVVEVSLRDGYNFYELIEFKLAAYKAPDLNGKAIPFPRRGMIAPWEKLIKARMETIREP